MFAQASHPSPPRSTLLRVIAGVGLAGALTACDPVATVEPTTLSQSPNAGPGPQHVKPSEAVNLFKAVCLDTAPSYAAATTVPASLPFTRNSRTGTVYHNRLNLSFKLTSDGCSFVAGGAGLDGARDTLRLVASDPTGKTDPRAPVTLDGQTYISVLRPKG